MATVWKARQISLDRIVAIKTLSTQFAVDPADVARFHAEAQSAAKLKHPGIVQVYDANMESGLYYFVMEYIDGYTVGDWIARSGRLSEKDALLVAECVAAALKYAWEKEQLVHCDIKPDNIMIDADGTVKVADLGLARTMRRMSGEGLDQEVLGTPSFMSPEQVRGEARLGCAADIYALGATLYQMLAGQALFEGHADEEIMEFQAAGVVDDPMDLNPALSRGTAFLIEAMLAKQPERRPQDWGAVVRDIHRVKRLLLPHSLLSSERQSTVSRGHRRMDSKPLPSYRIDAARPASPYSLWLKGAIAAGVPAAIVLALFLLTRNGATPSLPSSDPTEPLVGRLDPDRGGAEVSEAEKLFEYARQWAEDHPDRYNEAILKFRNVAQQTRGTPYMLKANTLANRLTRERNQQVDGLMAELRARGASLVEAGKFAEAAALYREYEGRLADETSRHREQAVEEAQAAQQAWERREARRRQEAAEHFEQALTEVAQIVLADGLHPAVLRTAFYVNEAPPAEHARAMEGVRQVILDAIQVDERILRSFRADRGRVTVVELRDGRKQVDVKEVTAEEVRGEEVRRAGSTEYRTSIRFDVSDLSMRERLGRMGGDDEPGVALAKGVLAYEARAHEHARTYMAQVPDPLGSRLLAAMGESVDSSSRRRAEEALATLLRSLDVRVEGRFDAERWLDAVQGADATPADRPTWLDDVQRYRATFADTPFLAQAEPILAALQERSQQAHAAARDAAAEAEDEAPAGRALRRVEDGTDHADLLRAMVRENPLLMESDVQMHVDEEDVLRRVDAFSPHLKSLAPIADLDTLKIVHSGGVHFRHRHRHRPQAPLSDLTPLASLKLEELYVGQTEVADLSPLQNMKLQSLYLGGTAVESVAVLRGMPLRILDLQRTAVRDLAPLDGTALRELNLRETPVFDFRPLRGMPLRDLNVSGTQFRDLDILRNMPLERLNLAGAGVHNFSRLRTLHLRHLDLSSTQIRDLSVLKGHDRLESLSLRGTGVSDLSVLRGKPLRSLDLAETRIRDFSPLADLPLRSLNLRGSAVREIGWVKKMPLQHLNVAHTAVRDLSSLHGKDLRHLDISRSNVDDLTALQEASVHRLSMRGVAGDVEPLQQVAVAILDLDQPERHLAVLRQIDGLERINGMTLPELVRHIAEQRN